MRCLRHKIGTSSVRSVASIIYIRVSVRACICVHAFGYACAFGCACAFGYACALTLRVKQHRRCDLAEQLQILKRHPGPGKRFPNASQRQAITVAMVDYATVILKGVTEARQTFDWDDWDDWDDYWDDFIVFSSRWRASTYVISDPWHFQRQWHLHFRIPVEAILDFAKLHDGLFGKSVSVSAIARGGSFDLYTAGSSLECRAECMVAGGFSYSMIVRGRPGNGNGWWSCNNVCQYHGKISPALLPPNHVFHPSKPAGPGQAPCGQSLDHFSGKHQSGE
jgi:hypothetical protein